ncbi:MarR family winged helix-turn-helix transcriptional regulator [Psychroserpens damuponensis]|uniref:MarR family winged helix-turn-helix transcriptional regulator n=1 Tax=Psychroserpens damuponensis TaxID=943936 RepID=UPI00058C3FF7|nr:MarR family transcriptional regulator [Psychroserpens damuponensis]
MKELNLKLKTTANLPLSRQTVINLFLTNTVVKTEMLSVLKPHDLSIEQFNVLRILRGQKGNPLNLQDIQERMVNKMSNTTRLIDKLILKDFVKRTECKNNRRKIEIYITATGLNKLLELDTIVNETEEKVTSKLTIKELEELNRLLHKIQ